MTHPQNHPPITDETRGMAKVGSFDRAQGLHSALS